MTITAFIDANVIADWILLRNLSRRRVDVDSAYTRSMPVKRYERIKSSYCLIEKLVKGAGEKRLRFITSQLAVNEVFYVLYDDVCSVKMYIEGIPTVMWPRFRDSIRLTEEEADELYRSILESFDEVFGGKQIEIVEDEANFEVFGFLVLRLGLRTHDATLMTTAILNKSDYFITRDRRILELSKEP